MRAISIRKIDDDIYEKLLLESKKVGISLNKFIIRCIESVVGSRKKVERHDLDEFFGTWSEEECRAVMEASLENRKIDKELWQ